MERGIPERSGGDLCAGLWFVFAVDGGTIAVWRSPWTTREKVWLNGELVATGAGFLRPSLSHEVRWRGERFRVAVRPSKCAGGFYDCTVLDRAGNRVAAAGARREGMRFVCGDQATETGLGPARSVPPRNRGFALICAGMAIYLAWTDTPGIGEATKGMLSPAWPEVEARVVGSGIVRECDDCRAHCPDITYRYSYEGRFFESNRFRYGDGGCTTADLAREVAERYPVGRVIRVHVDAKRPRDATIETGLPERYDWSHLIQGVIVLLVLAVVAVLYWTGRLRDEEA